MELLNPKLENQREKPRTLDQLAETFEITRQRWLQVLHFVKAIGFSTSLDDYERRKLSVFNQLNFFQLLTGVLIPLMGMLHSDAIPNSAWWYACMPSCISVVVLLLNYFGKFNTAVLTYFILYPFFTCIVYMNGMNAGIELHFLLYGVLSVFFLQGLGYMVFTLALTMMNYFIVAIVLKHFIYQVETENKFIYILNQLVALGFIFYGLYLIKRENSSYQWNILAKNDALHQQNIEIEKQKEEIAEKAKLLEVQRYKLSELNSLKSKLFSVIAHDLKSPMYALRNLFRNMHQFDLPAEEVKTMVPDVVNDLNYTISLMENLLQWAKTQMQSNAVRPQTLNMTEMVEDVTQLLRLQAEAKHIAVVIKSDGEAIEVFADKDMLSLVLRNLLSNAIKFTPDGGTITIGVSEITSFVEVYVQDSGTGISKEAMQKINENNFYTTKGTSSESGTGLGLMLCKEFLTKNNGQMFIESEPGVGSTFSFTLPKPE